MVEAIPDIIENDLLRGLKGEYVTLTRESLELKEKFGSKMKNIPLGAVGLYTYCQKFKVGLQQLMAGSRNFRLSTISRKDLMALTEEAAKISGIPYVMDAYGEEANKILEE